MLVDDAAFNRTVGAGTEAGGTNRLAVRYPALAHTVEPTEISEIGTAGAGCGSTGRRAVRGIWATVGNTGCQQRRHGQQQNESFHYSLPK